MALSQVRPVILVKPSPREFQPLLRKLIQDRLWAVEKKHDGHRCMVIFDGQKVSFLNKQGEGHKTIPKQFGVKVVELFKRNGISSIVLDGEIVGYENGQPSRHFVPKLKATQVLFAFDLLLLNGADFLHLPYWKRKKYLKHLLGIIDAPGDIVRYVPYASKPLTKAEFIAQQWRGDAEGVVFKHVLGKYTDCWYKFKNDSYSKKGPARSQR